MKPGWEEAKRMVVRVGWALGAVNYIREGE